MAAQLISTSDRSVTTGIETFTPEAAHNALQSDFVNRHPSRRAVWKFADAMRRGQWTIGQPLIFDERGALIDGQHRLLAVIKSGSPQTFTVIRGVLRSSALHIDVGTPRSATAILKMRGAKNVAALAATTRIVVAMERGAPDPSQSSNTDHPATIDDIVLRALEDPIIATVATDLVGPTRQFSRLLCSTSYAGWFLYCLRAGLTERFQLYEDFIGIVLGHRVATQVNDPAHTLRCRLTKPENATAKTPSIIRLALTVKAWNGFAQSQPIETLRYRSVGSAAEEFPRPVLDVPVLAAGKERQ